MMHSMALQRYGTRHSIYGDSRAGVHEKRRDMKECLKVSGLREQYMEMQYGTSIAPSRLKAIHCRAL